LRDYEGYSYLEIADILNISEDTVKVTIFRARKSLKEYLVHVSGLDDEIRDGDELELQEGKKGLNVVNIKVI
jgi:predicted DNA-binding protein (UPF0251 family)